MLITSHLFLPIFFLRGGIIVNEDKIEYGILFLNPCTQLRCHSRSYWAATTVSHSTRWAWQSQGAHTQLCPNASQHHDCSPQPLHLLRALGLLFAECIWRTKMHASGTDAGSEKTPSTLWEQQEVSGCVCLFHIWNPGILNFGIKDKFYKTCWCTKNNQLLGKERWIWFRMNQINYVA